MPFEACRTFCPRSATKLSELIYRSHQVAKCFSATTVTLQYQRARQCSIKKVADCRSRRIFDATVMSNRIAWWLEALFSRATPGKAGVWSLMMWWEMVKCDC
jgi:hypothetical protein